MLKIYNSLTKQKHEFKPLKAGTVGMYVCGITTYDYSHIGHARAYILFDIILRYLRYRQYNVYYVRNITDIDDKIIKRAQENNESCDVLTERFVKAWHEDAKALGILPPDDEPRATEHIPQIIQLIETLLEKNCAYIADNGDVYFDVRRFKDYGKLSHRNIDQLIAGTRVEVNENKRDPLDFVLWKMAKPNEPHWPSPWGEGRPGWHIECSAMSTARLGQPFDIHGGGMDLKFPHHENEIAQSEAATHTDFAKIWMHVGLLMVNQEKMSKSLGNFFTIREVLLKYHPEILRYFMVSAHYRSPVNYSEANMQKAYQSLSRLYVAVRGLPEVNENSLNEFEQRFQEAMDDDFNTPQALAVLFDLTREINRLREQGDAQHAASLASSLKRLAQVFGVLQDNPDVFLKGEVTSEETAIIKSLIDARNKARQEKNWAEADRLRNELLHIGIAIEDTPDGTLWRKEG